MAGEADNSEYWDALARGMGTVVRPVCVLHPADATAANREALERAGYTVVIAVQPVANASVPPRPPVAFGGYVAVPNNHADGSLYAYWMDGRLAAWNSYTRSWIGIEGPDYATLFPASPSAPFVTAASNPTVGEGPRRDD